MIILRWLVHYRDRQTRDKCVCEFRTRKRADNFAARVGGTVEFQSRANVREELTLKNGGLRCN